MFSWKYLILLYRSGLNTHRIWVFFRRGSRGDHFLLES